MSVHWFKCPNCDKEFTHVFDPYREVAICPYCYSKKVIDLKNDKKHKQKEVNVQ
jgi:DNA-directed RNA polymerase subunit RPC12/RpoP